ncbi:MAG: Hpt domain-containing protein [Pseudomonadota bacterium]
MTDDILSEFIEDAREHLQGASQHLLALEKNPGLPDELHGLLRRLHTIKGNAGFLDLKSLYDLTHKTENILQTVREQPRQECPQGLIDILFQVLDTIEAMLNNLAAGKSDYVNWLGSLIASLERIDQALSSAAPGHKAGERPEPADEKWTPGLPETQTEGPVSLESTPWEIKSEAPVSSEVVVGELEAEPPIIRFRGMIQSFRDRLFALDDDSEAETVIQALQELLAFVQAEAELQAGPNSRLALKLIQNYLNEFQALGRRISGPARTLLEGLLDNLQAWLEFEPTLSQAGPAVLQLVADDLSGDGLTLIDRVRLCLKGDQCGLIFDLRAVQALHTPQVALLIQMLNMVPDKKRAALVLNTVVQAGLFRVLKLKGMELIFPIFPDEDQARAHLGGNFTGQRRF